MLYLYGLIRMNCPCLQPGIHFLMVYLKLLYKCLLVCYIRMEYLLHKLLYHLEQGHPSNQKRGNIDDEN